MSIIKNHGTKVLAILLAAILSGSLLPYNALASNAKTQVPGKVYEFGTDNTYMFSKNDTFAETVSENTYGSFSIDGNVSNVETRDGIAAYEIADGNISFYYNYSDTLLNADIDSWHLIEDKCSTVDEVKLPSDILKGAIIVQTSKDRLNWLDAVTFTNAFQDVPVRTDAIYSSKDIELINGCYYRVIVAYELRIRTEASNFLFINTDKHDYKRIAEVYEFYAYTDSGEASVSDPSQKYNLGKKVRAKNFDGYYGEDTIKKDDAHYGWELGQFFVSGYTEEIVLEDNVVFLKNVGDKVTLWFNLKQNINALDGDSSLSITPDTAGFDQYFETETTDFGRGTLIIRHTDHNNIQGEPTIYTNYLEANVSVGADTKVQLFEEGDYEVALDYQVTSDQLIDQVGHYRIFFTFSVRNGNCMAYPFDLGTGSELTNSSMTENGFRLDLAKSRYLKVNLKREVLKDSADGLVEDTRFNGPAQDGAQYTDEGIYTITVSNEYTNQFTVKKIYVGRNAVLKAHMATGLSIPEINHLVAEGATISDAGQITLASTIVTEPVVTPETDYTEGSTPAAQGDNADTALNSLYIILIAAGVALVIVVCILIFRKKPAKSSKYRNQGDDEI